MADVNDTVSGQVHKIETFGLVDGPGVRFVVFVSGCKMRCKFCHNPDTWNSGGEKRTASEVWKQARRYKSYWKNNGGITVSGGEPLLQMDFVTSLFSLAKNENVHTAIDTAGQPFSDNPEWLAGFEKLMSVTDLVILDLKEMNPVGHKELTGVDNENILHMAEWLSKHGKKMWIRHVLVPGITDSQEDLFEMKKFISSLKTVEKVEILPYHTLGIMKWEELGIPYPLRGVPTPTPEQIQEAQKILK